MQLLGDPLFPGRPLRSRPSHPKMSSTCFLSSSSSSLPSVKRKRDMTSSILGTIITCLLLMVFSSRGEFEFHFFLTNDRVSGLFEMHVQCNDISMSFWRREIVMTVKVQAADHIPHTCTDYLSVLKTWEEPLISPQDLFLLGFDVLFIYFWVTTNVEIGDYLIDVWIFFWISCFSLFFCCYSTIKFCSRTIREERRIDGKNRQGKNPLTDRKWLLDAFSFCPSVSFPVSLPLLLSSFPSLPSLLPSWLREEWQMRVEDSLSSLAKGSMVKDTWHLMRGKRTENTSQLLLVSFRLLVLSWMKCLATQTSRLLLNCLEEEEQERCCFLCPLSSEEREERSVWRLAFFVMHVCREYTNVSAVTLQFCQGWQQIHSQNSRQTVISQNDHEGFLPLSLQLFSCFLLVFEQNPLLNKRPTKRDSTKDNAIFFFSCLFPENVVHNFALCLHFCTCLFLSWSSVLIFVFLHSVLLNRKPHSWMRCAYMSWWMMQDVNFLPLTSSSSCEVCWLKRRESLTLISVFGYLFEKWLRVISFLFLSLWLQ